MTNESDDEEAAAIEGIRFRMYSPTPEESKSFQKPIPLKQMIRRTYKAQKKKEEDQGLVGDMKNFIYRKKLDFSENVSSFVKRLNEAEAKLQEN